MTERIAIVTDSAAMLPPALIAGRNVLVAPLSIVLDGAEYADGVDITADELYARLPSVQQIATSQPSPGRLLECYREAASAGATAILSIHIGAGISGTLGSAELAAKSSPVPVTLVDTGQASFAEGLCVLEALDALDAGAGAGEVAELARRAGSAVGNTFVVKALDLVRRGGRLRDEGEEPPAGVPVLVLQPDGIKVAGSATTLHEAVQMMAAHVEAAARVAEQHAQSLRIGIGNGAAPEIAEALRDRVRTFVHVDDVIEYVVGPSMGAHLGPGNAGAVFIARPLA